MFVFQAAGEGNERVIFNGKETRIINDVFAPKTVEYNIIYTLTGPAEKMNEVDRAEIAFIAAVDNYLEGVKSGQPPAVRSELDRLGAKFKAAVKDEFGRAIMDNYTAGKTATEPVDLMYEFRASLKSIVGSTRPSTEELGNAYNSFVRMYHENILIYLPSGDPHSAQNAAKRRENDGYAVKTYEQVVKPEPATPNGLGSKVSEQGLAAKGWKLVNQPAAKQQKMPSAL